MIFEPMLAFFVENFWAGVLTALGGFIGGAILTRIWGRYKQHRLRRTRSQEDTIDFSLTTFTRVDDHVMAMKIRPLEEASIEDVIPNGGLIQTVKQAARQTTPEQPMVVIPHEVDRELIGNALIKRWNGHFRDAVIAQFLGAPVVERKAVMALTYERAVRSGMLRCMIILCDDCQWVSDFLQSKTQDKVLLESPHHDQRLRTIFAIHERYLADQDMDEKQRTVRDYFIASTIGADQ